MQRSTDRMLTTHMGCLPRPTDLRELLAARARRQPHDEAAFARRLPGAVAEVVRQQVAGGVDVVNDGELSKHNWMQYVRDRLSGIEDRPWQPGEERPIVSISGRDQQEFPDYFAAVGGRASIGTNRRQVYSTGPLRYVGQAALQADLANLRAALDGESAAQAFMTAVAPAQIEHFVANDYYPSDEAYLYAIADAMHEEYRAIVDAGFMLQIDDPELPNSWQIHPELGLDEYRRMAARHVDVLNHALRDLPPERIRVHVCWGSYHGPHKHDVPLRDIVDLLLRIRATAYALEASNPRHAHEWRVWEDVKLPAGKVLVPGVVSHCSDFVEHPELVAERLVRYAALVGRENVIAGTDCGLGERVGHPSIVWAKLEALAEGARLATRQLWG